MPINELIAGGIKLPQFNLPDYGADLAQMAQIQNARNQNALAQYQLGAAQRAENENNQLRALFSKPDVDRSSPDFIRQIYAISPKEGQEYTKNLLEQQVKKATFQKTESDLLAADVERSAEALASAQDIQSYKAIHNAIHKDPNSRLGKYFASIGFDRTKADELITQAENDPSGQLFLNLRYMSGLKGRERADQMRAQTEAAQLRSPPQPGAIQSVGAQAPVPTENALGVPETGVSNAMVAQPAPTTAPKSRIDFVKSQIDQFSNVLSNNPSNKLAADRLKALTDEYNQLSAEQGREATLSQRKLEAEQRQKLDEQKHQLEINKFNASQKEFKVEKTPQGLVQINKDGTVAPILGADGKQVQSLEFAKSEIKTNADGNYIAFNPYTNESRIITGADGKPVRSLDAATKAEQERHNRELERQGNVKIGQENRRIQLAQQQANEPKYNSDRGGFVYPPSKENPEGRFVPLTGGDGKPLTEGQGKSTAYGLRMTEANQILEKLANEGTERAAIGAGAPYGIGAIVNKATASPQQQQVYQAKLNFITANLRQESGAVIGESEFETEDKKYFPQIGDSPEVLAQKKRARQLAIKAMEVQAGPGAKEIEKFRDSSKSSAAPSGSPKIGSVQEGYKFKGGDPANPKNWEKL